MREPDTTKHAPDEVTRRIYRILLPPFCFVGFGVGVSRRKAVSRVHDRATGSGDVCRPLRSGSLGRARAARLRRAG